MSRQRVLSYKRGRVRLEGVREWTWLLPLLLVIGVASAFTCFSSEPSRLDLARTFAAPSGKSPLGCGEGGINLSAFVGYACLRSLCLSTVVAFLACFLGVSIGTLAAQWRGRVERLILGTCDLVQAFPTFLVALAVLSAVRSPERWHLGVVFSMLSWAPFARVTHILARNLIHSEFVVAAQAFGAGKLHIARQHIVPHLVGPLAVQVGTTAAGVVLSEASLGFIGLGPADGVSLGSLLEQGTVAMLREPRILLVSACAIAATSGALQLASEGLRSVLTSRTSTPT